MGDKEIEVFREGVPHGNYMSVTLRLAPSTGDLSLREYRTSERGYAVDYEDHSIAEYLAARRHTKACRAVEAYLHKFAIAFEKLAPPKPTAG